MEDYKERRETLRKFYNSKLWKNVRETALMRDNYLCQICAKEGKTVPADIVHHKIHLSLENLNNDSIAINLDNLISVCKPCHDRIHSSEHGRGRIIQEDYPYMFDENGMLIPKP